MAATAAAGGLLAGCGSGGGSSSSSRVVVGTREDPAKQPLYDDNPMIESGLEPEKGPLRVYNWADYMYKRVLDDFEKEFGVEVDLTTFYNLEEATRKLRTGKVSFDVFVPTAEIVPKFVAGKLMQPLNHDYLPNLKKNIWPMLAEPLLRPGLALHGAIHRLPHRHRLAHGHGQRRHRCDGQPLGSLLGPRVQGDQRGCTTITGRPSGSGCTGTASPTSTATRPSDLEAARESLVELTDLVNIRYTIDGAYAKLPEGVFGIHHAWSGDMVNAPYYMPKGGDPSVLRYVWPPKAQGGAGGYVSNDNLAVLKDAEHPVLAHMFLNYMLDDRVSIKNFSWNAYQPPIEVPRSGHLGLRRDHTREPGVDGNRAGRLRGGPDAAAANAGAGRALAGGVVEGPAGRLGP